MQILLHIKFIFYTFLSSHIINIYYINKYNIYYINNVSFYILVCKKNIHFKLDKNS